MLLALVAVLLALLNVADGADVDAADVVSLPVCRLVRLGSRLGPSTSPVGTGQGAGLHGDEDAGHHDAQQHQPLQPGPVILIAQCEHYGLTFFSSVFFFLKRRRNVFRSDH